MKAANCWSTLKKRLIVRSGLLTKLRGCVSLSSEVLHQSQWRFPRAVLKGTSSMSRGNNESSHCALGCLRCVDLGNCNRLLITCKPSPIHATPLLLLYLHCISHLLSPVPCCIHIYIYIYMLYIYMYICIYKYVIHVFICYTHIHICVLHTYIYIYIDIYVYIRDTCMHPYLKHMYVYQRCSSLMPAVEGVLCASACAAPERCGDGLLDLCGLKHRELSEFLGNP